MSCIIHTRDIRLQTSCTLIAVHLSQCACPLFPGHGFLPRQTSQHHQEWVLSLVHAALTEANVKPRDLDAVAYTKGPGMGGPLQTCAVVARTLSQVWNIPIVAVNHCIGRQSTTGESNARMIVMRHVKRAGTLDTHYV